MITGVSGGSFTALAYGLYGEKLFADYEQRFLKRDVQGELISRSLSPRYWGDYIGGTAGRSELAANYYDEIRTVNDPTDPTYDFVEDARWIFDTSAQYDFGNGFTLRGGINNLLDEMPDGDPTGWDGPALPWSLENSQWGLAGRIYYLRAAYAF